MDSLKICIWMNIPSHHQSGFFEQLHNHGIDLEVRYFQDSLPERRLEGWNSYIKYQSYEQCVTGYGDLSEILETVPDALERIHIISSNFSPGLVEYFCKNNYFWCHWSEMPGIRLAQLLNFNTVLFRLISPLFLKTKYHDGARIDNYALTAFGQGVLAKKYFKKMGIRNSKISDLFYCPRPLEERTPSKLVKDFANGRKVFLSVSALCKRKGIDVLIRSFSKIDSDDWCLVLCGLDKENGKYQKLSEQLGLGDRVLFLGSYPSDAISEVFCAADVFILPTRFDGWGAVLNEAASLGLPLISTDLCGAAWHLIKEGHNGYRVKAESTFELRRAMMNYINNSELIKSHGSNSMSLFFEEFTPEKNVQRLVGTINSLPKYIR